MKNLLFICFIMFGLSSCNNVSTKDKVAAKDLKTNSKGLIVKINPQTHDSVVFTGVSVDSSFKNDEIKGVLVAKYSDGKLDGSSNIYYLSGKLYLEEEWKNGEEDGKWTWYNEKGEVSSERVFKDGSYEATCPCCNKKFWSKYGWTPTPRAYARKMWTEWQNGGRYCSQKCAIDCR